MKSDEVWTELKEYILTSGILYEIWDEYAQYSYNENVDKYDFHSKEFFMEQAVKGLNKHKPWTRRSRVKTGDKIVREMDVMAHGDGTDWTSRNIIPTAISFVVTEENDQITNIETVYSDDWGRSRDSVKKYCPAYFGK